MLRAKITNSMQIPSEGKRLFSPIHTKSAVSIKNTKPHIQFQTYRNIGMFFHIVFIPLLPKVSLNQPIVMKTNISLILILCLLLGACKNGNASSQNKSETPQDTIKAIKMPAIPQMMTAPEQRADFLAKHYWDNVNFADTNYIHHPEVTEQAWADYCDLLNHVPLETAQQAMRNVIDRTNVDKKVFTYITDLADKYLYDPNSPCVTKNFIYRYWKQ